MPGKQLFEYAIIRIVPRVEREEFLNTGVVLYCKDRKFLDAQCTLDTRRLEAFGSDLDLEELKAYLDVFHQVCKGGRQAGPIGALPIMERFRWLTATRSTIVQTSKVHAGFCDDPKEMLERIFSEMVG